MAKSEFMREFEREIMSWFVGIAIPCEKKIADDIYGPVICEKVLKFNRKALRNIGKRKVTKVDSRYIGGEDTMRFKVGKPGSRERVEALMSQYASLADDEMSPFTI